MFVYMYAVKGARELREGNIGPAVIDINESIKNLSYIGYDIHEEGWAFCSPISWHPNSKKAMFSEISRKDRKIQVFFDVVYRATQDGDKEIVVRNRIDDCCEFLTLFDTYEGGRFGIYIKREKDFSLFRGKNYKEIPGSCFIVGLNNLILYPINKDKISNDNFTTVLCFGRMFYKNRNGTYWMIYTPQNHFLKQKCIMGNGEGLFDNINVQLLVGAPEYHIKEVEIFSIDIER